MEKNDADPDFLDELIAEATAENPDFPQLLEESVAARDLNWLILSLRSARRAKKVTQIELAQRMGIGGGQSLISRIESEEHDPRLSTACRYARALGLELTFRERH